MTTPSAVNSQEYVSCYNCTGAKMPFLCGCPMPGCLLCQTHGAGSGKLLPAFRNVSVAIVRKDGTSATFNPPSYECLRCKDKKKIKQSVWDESLATGNLGFDEHRMPKFMIACPGCNPEQSKLDYEAAKTKYFAEKKTQTPQIIANL